MNEQKDIQRALCEKVIMLAKQLERWQEIFKKDTEAFIKNPCKDTMNMMEVSTRHVFLNSKWKEEAIDRLNEHKAKYGDLMQ